jgi:hypothetical protein
MRRTGVRFFSDLDAAVATARVAAGETAAAGAASADSASDVVRKG